MDLTIIAASGPRFADFQPYVPAIDEAGRVVFQAALADGGSGVFLGDGGASETLLEAHDGTQFCSHPDRNEHGDFCVYATRADGSAAVLGVREGAPFVYCDTRDGRFRAIGPLGPVIDGWGDAGFRAELADGRAAVCAACEGRLVVLAETGERFSAFHGLPVLAGAAGLVFRADRIDGVHGVYLAAGTDVRVMAETGAAFAALSLFPSVNARGDIAFGATLPAGETVAVVQRADGRQSLVRGPGAGFESVRGALLDEGGNLYLTATPAGGTLGAYRVHDGEALRLLGLGDALLGGRLEGFALNPVSVNSRRQLAIRLLLQDGRQFIARLEVEATG